MRYVEDRVVVIVIRYVDIVMQIQNQCAIDAHMNKIQVYLGEIGNQLTGSEYLRTFLTAKLHPGLEGRLELVRIKSVIIRVLLRFTSTMANAMYLMQKLNCEFYRERKPLQVRLGDRLSEYAWREWIQFSGVEYALAYHPPPTKAETVGFRYRQIVLEHLPRSGTTTATSVTSLTCTDWADGTNDVQLTEYLAHAGTVPLPPLFEEDTYWSSSIAPTRCCTVQFRAT